MSKSDQNQASSCQGNKPLWAFVNGRYVDNASALISIHDRSVMYGDAIYTTLKVRSSRPVFFDAHIKRLRADTSRLKFGEVADIDDIVTIVQKIISLNEISLGYVRITISRGTKLEFPSLHASAPSILVIAGSTDFLSSRSALSVITVPEGRDQFRDVKTTNRLVALHALASASEQNAQEAIFTDHQQLVEATCSNLIESRGGRLFTPALHKKGLAGIARQILIDQAGVTISEVCSDTSGPLYLTNCLAGIQPVSHLNGRELTIDTIEISRLRDILEQAELKSISI